MFEGIFKHVRKVWTYEGMEKALDLLQANTAQALSRIDASLDRNTASSASPKGAVKSDTSLETSPKSMTVGVMTLPLNKNFGGNIQAFAMMEVLRQLGHKPILINRRHPYDLVDDADIVGEDNDKPLLSSSYGMNASIPNSSFIDKYITPISRKFNSTSQLSQNIGKYNLDALIVGSDQVWRAKYARSILLDFFFAFLPEEDHHIKRISYAASFGADKLAYGAEVLREAARLVQKFDAASVREDVAVALCRKHLGVDAQHVLDPTLLLLSNDYVRLFSDKQFGYTDGRLLAYVLDANGDKGKVISEISRRLSIRAYATNGLPFGSVSALQAGDGDRSIEGWLASFHGAAFVVTDSFHGVVFSILFNKPFIAYGNPRRGVARFSSLLKMFGLEDRLVVHSDEMDLERMLKPINWDAVNDRLAKLRAKSLRFLKSALSGDKAEEKQLAPATHSILKAQQQKGNAGSIAANPLKVLCTGCGVCVSESRGSLKMAWNEDGFLVPQAKSPNIPPEAVKVCPFNTKPDKEVEDEDALAKTFLPNATKFDPSAGRFERVYVGYSRQFRATSSSGGVSTYVLKKLMERGEVDYLFVVQSDGASGYRYRVCKDISDFRTISKTRYFPVSMEELFSVIDRTEGRVAVTGVACFIKAIRLKQYYRPEYREKIPFLLGIICGGLKSRGYTDFLAQSARIAGPYTNPEYRVKDPQSTATDYSFSAIDAQSQAHSIKMRRVGSNWGAGLFKPRACDFCSDVLTELADISLGDAWLPKWKADGMGNNVVLTRTELADDIIRAGIKAGDLSMEEVSVSLAIKSQAGAFNHRQNGLKFRAWTARHFSTVPVPKLRERVLKDISVSEAVVQIHRQRTRSKSLRYWNETHNAEAFKLRMRASRRGLDVATAARKDGSNVALISILAKRQIDPGLLNSDPALRRQLMVRWLMQKIRGRQFNFDMLRAALFGMNPVRKPGCGDGSGD